MEKLKKQTRKVENEKSSYLVKTKGYKETFNSLEQARNQFEILKKRAVKNQANIAIQIFERKKGNQELIDEVQITESFYEVD